MSNLRTRIEQRITDLRVERDIAAGGRPWEANGSTVRLAYPFPPAVVADCQSPEVATHIATQDPATTTARIDRELAGCAADLALLDWLERYLDKDRDALAWDNLYDRYPTEEPS